MKVDAFISLDIETLGAQQNAIILQIGAVLYLRGVHGIFENVRQLSLSPSIDEQVRIGRVISHGTLSWWACEYPQLFQEQLSESHLTAVETLHALGMLFDSARGSDRSIEVWVRGPHFDIAILEHWYAHYDHRRPWRYDEVRDLRTLHKCGLLVDVEHDEAALPPKHDAVGDALRQGQMIVEFKARNDL